MLNGDREKKDITFFYRIAKEAGWAEDENGNPAACYLKIGFTLKKPMSNEQAETERIKAEVLKGAAHLLGVDIAFLTVVSEEEYLAETGE